VGYFGARHLAVARALSRFAPRVLGLRGGVLYRQWLPADRALDATSDDFATAVAAYVAERRRLLGVARDMSVGLAGERPVWEVAALILARGFGRVAPLMRVVLVDRLVRRLLAVTRPSVLDGNMTAEHWFQDGDRQPVKVCLSDRTNWRLGLTSFDAAFDLAAVGASSSDGVLAGRVREAWRAETGEQVDSERWLLYELAHLWGVQREDRVRDAEARHAAARAAARYFANALFDDIGRSGHGPLCALDIDGVLETDRLGFPTLTRASATALRALFAHGFRPVVVTGRGLAEVRDRCRAYALAGGVAEYGSVIWVDGGQGAARLLSTEAAAALRRLRAVLRECEGVRLDPAFSCAVRAYRIDGQGGRRPLGSQEVAECLDASGGTGTIRAIPGDSQTDFVAVGVDKGKGLRALIGALEAHQRDPHELRVSLAVGDTAADAPMLALASAAFVPAHAAPTATSTGARRVARPYQAGLYRAVAELLGHEPGSCRRCRVTGGPHDRDLLLDLLSVAEDGPRGLAAGAIRLAWRAVT
jgi:hydroxymethylpyrimidine pyrophosphatase-like HAD family hydrolase